MKKHDLAEYIEEINLTLSQDYKQIQKRVREDPGTAGDQGEETWAGVLRKWLPSHFHVVTKGRILGQSGEASPQIDVLVLWPNYPPFLLEKKMYLASGVAAAFEVKLTLRKKHLSKIFETAVRLSEVTEKEHWQRLRNKKRSGGSFAYQEYHRVFEYGLLAHSFEESDTAKAYDFLDHEIRKLDRDIVQHPTQMLDLVCVHGLGSWVSEREAIFGKLNLDQVNPQDSKMVYLQHPYTNYRGLFEGSWAEGSEQQDNFSPLGSFLARLYRKLARVDPSLLPLAQFYTHALATGQGGGDGGRLWAELQTPDEIWCFSEPLRRRNQPLYRDEFSFLGF